MKYVVVPAATVQRNGRGLFQHLVLTESPGADPGTHLDVAGDRDPAYQAQVDLTSKLMARILEAMEVAPCGGALLSVEPSSKLEGGSHGLALLLGLIAYHLDLPLRSDVAFSAQLSSTQHRSPDLALESVQGVTAKAMAAGNSDVQSLYFHSRDSAELELATEYMRARFRQDSAAICDLLPLRRSISWLNLLNLGIDFKEAWPRIQQEHHPLATSRLQFAWVLLNAASKNPALAGEFPHGIGSFIAECRAQGHPGLQELHHLPLEDLRASLDEDRARDLIKLAISTNPSASIDADLTAWMEERNPQSVAAPCNSLISSLITIYDLASSYCEVTENTQNWLKTHIAERLLSFEQESHGDDPDGAQAIRILESITRMTGERRDFAALALHAMQGPIESGKLGGKRLFSLLTMLWQSQRSATQQVQEAPDSYLTLRFSEVPGELPKHCIRLSEINDLMLTYSGPQLLSCTVTSPVLLLELSRALGSYTRREGFCIADDPSARIPPKDLELILSQFGSEVTRIEFDCREPGAATPEPIGVFWNPSAVPFPPAVDAQFAARTLVTRLPRENPIFKASARSLIDVGCGTGYLAAVAAHKLSELERIVMLDSCAASVEASISNLDHARRKHEPNERDEAFSPVAPQAERIPIVSSLQSYHPEDRFDVLLCNPPYLPLQHLASGGITAATNGTELLEEVVLRAASLARLSFIACSTIAWPELSACLERAADMIESVIVLSREFVPLRIPWIEPVPVEDFADSGDRREKIVSEFEEKKEYYESILQMPGRDLIDLDSGIDETDLANRAANSGVRPIRAIKLFDSSGLDTTAYGRKFKSMLEGSRGFRFWHEIRVLRIEARE